MPCNSDRSPGAARSVAFMRNLYGYLGMRAPTIMRAIALTAMPPAHPDPVPPPKPRRRPLRAFSRALLPKLAGQRAEDGPSEGGKP